jgi:hypothetical protein
VLALALAELLVRIPIFPGGGILIWVLAAAHPRKPRNQSQPVEDEHQTTRDTRARPQSITLFDIEVIRVGLRHGKHSVSPRLETLFVDLQARDLRVKSLTRYTQLRGSSRRS